jgi:hypothetical protein
MSFAPEIHSMSELYVRKKLDLFVLNLNILFQVIVQAHIYFLQKF